jgi:hypothetical protein
MPIRPTANRHDPLPCALAHHLEAAVGAEVTRPQPGQLGEAQPGVEHEQDDGAVADRRSVEHAAQGRVIERLDELVGDPRPA